MEASRSCEAGLLDLGAEVGQFALEVTRDRGVLRERSELGEIRDASFEAVPAIDARADEVEPLQQLLRVLTIVPEVGLTRRLL